MNTLFCNTHKAYYVWLSISLTLMLIASTARAQSTGEGEPAFKSFELQLPDEITQDIPFIMRVTLTATNWKEPRHHPSNDVKIRKGKWTDSKKAGGNYWQTTCELECVTSHSGEIELPSFTAIVSGQTVSSHFAKLKVKPHPEYGVEMTEATKRLFAQGLASDDCTLTLMAKLTNCMLFHDRLHKKYAFTARKEFASLLGGDLLLAYSGESALNASVNEEFKSVLFYYDRLLGDMANGAKMWEPNGDTISIKPMLQTEWAQNEPYNQFTPIDESTGKHTLVGCIPVATGQIMKYHSHPIHDDGYWTGMPLRYDGAMSNEDFASIAKLLATIGEATSARFGVDKTAVDLENVKAMMTMHFGFSPQMMEQKGIDCRQFAKIASEEIANHRPFIASTERHAIVCDGSKGHFIHLNFGWGGYCNAYFRILSAEGSAAEWPLSHIISHIEPSTGEPMARHLMLTEPGTLRERLSDEEQHKVAMLTIAGPLNSSDMRLIRQMAGAIPEDGDRWVGSLTTLDLNDATFLTDTTFFYRSHPTEKWTRRTTLNGEETGFQTYDFNNMTDSLWNEFRNTEMASGEGQYYSRDSTGTFWVNYHTEQHTIGKKMFANCQNLRKLIVPSNTLTVGAFAFCYCSCLTDIVIPESAEKVSKHAFGHLSLLRRQ